MLTWEDADSTSSHRHTKSATIQWINFLWKRPKKLAKTFLNKGLKDNINMGRRVRGAVSPKISPLAQQPRGARDLTHVELLPEELGVCALYQAPQTLQPAWERWAPNTFGFENQQGRCSEDAEGWRDWKVPSCRATHTRTQHKLNSVESS